MLMFLLDLFCKKHPSRVLFLTIGALLVLGVAAGFLAAQPAEPRVLFNGMIASDPFATFWNWLFLSAAGLTVLIAAGMKILLASRWIRGKGSASEPMEEESRLESVQLDWSDGEHAYRGNFTSLIPGELPKSAMPSCPSLSFPQHCTAPATTAHEKSNPTAVMVAPLVMPETGTVTPPKESGFPTSPWDAPPQHHT
jgi:hypothetical protein